MNLYRTKEFFFLIVITILIISSCKKEDSVVIEEEEKPIETKVEMLINGKKIITDAFATYCVDQDSEFLAISNKEVLLDTAINIFDFAEEDFVFQSVVDDTISYTLAGVALGESITGFQGLLILYNVDFPITITSNDGTIVEGFVSGTFFGINPNTQQPFFLPYSLTFSALIVEQSTYCD